MIQDQHNLAAHQYSTVSLALVYTLSFDPIKNSKFAAAAECPHIVHIIIGVTVHVCVYVYELCL